ncbi:amiloride-sensitive sodium channel domain-containing protein [Phthorimaea operculella]|nr:amiloride-sensitive sodium channel domain-containing protein [Phthorimaea operculella]
MTKIKPKTVKFKLNTRNKLETMKTPKFLERITTIHGTNFFRVMRGKSLFAWSLLMIAHATLTIAFLVIIKERYNTDQIVTKIYSDWSVDKVPFPAVSICNFNPVSKNESKTIEKILLEHNIPRENIEYFFQDLYYLLDFDIGSLQVRDHSRIMNILKVHYYTVTTIMEEVQQKCSNLLVYCEFNGKPKVCDDVFHQIQTYAGYCCAFNFNGVDDEGSDPMMSPDYDFEYYSERSADSMGVKTNIIATSEYGSSSGLRVVFNVETDDYANWSNVPAFGAKVLLSDPNDYVETRVLYKYIDIGESIDLKVEPLIFDCEDNLRYVDVEKRHWQVACYWLVDGDMT